MSIVWTLIATFLYAEIVIVLLFVLPIASPARWQRFFRSRFLAMLSRQAQTYFYLLVGVLILFLLEAIREMRKYSQIDTHSERAEIAMQHSMRLFRAQRNFYISGFSIFLTLVIRRLVILISEQASLLAQSEASMSQAKSATTAARTLLAQQKDKETKEAAKKNETKDESVNNSTAAKEKAETEKLLWLKIGELKQKLADLNAELTKERKDKEAMKSQSESLNREYDRLTEEYSKLQRNVTLSSGKND